MPFSENVFQATKSNCMAQAKTCSHIECRYHVVNGAAKKARQRNVSITCSLSCSTRDHTLDEIGQFLGITRERVRQIEHVALAKFMYGLKKAGVIKEMDMKPARFKSLLSIARRTFHSRSVAQEDYDLLENS